MSKKIDETIFNTKKGRDMLLDIFCEVENTKPEIIKKVCDDIKEEKEQITTGKKKRNRRIGF